MSVRINVDGTIENLDTGVVTKPVEQFKNYIIDGDFNFWYEGTSQTTAGYGSDTMWFNGNVGSTKTHSRYTLTDTERALVGCKYGSQTVVTSVVGAGNYVDKYQKIEDVATLSGQTATISFWAKADTSKNIAVELSQNFGLGGTPASPVTGIGSQLIALTTSFKKYTITVDIPTIVGKTLGTSGDSLLLLFWFDAGSDFDSRTASLGQQSGTFTIANVQLEEGSYDTSFDNSKTYSDLGVHRFYKTGFFKIQYTSSNMTSNQQRIIENLLGMRTITPTISRTNVLRGGTLYNDSIQLSQGTLFANWVEPGSIAGQVYSFNWVADARL